MSDIYEVVIQGVLEDDLFTLLKILESDAKMVSGVSVSEDVDLSKGKTCIDKSLVGMIVAYDGSICVSEKIYGFNILELIELQEVFVRVLKYENYFDVELSFSDSNEIDIANVMRNIQQYIIGLSKNITFEEFYGGMEPAADFETRYFTNKTLGPLGL